MPQMNPGDPMVILGIDPGLANTGWGVVSRQRGGYRCLAYGCVTTSSDTDTAQRLKTIHAELEKVIDRFNPTELGIESVYFGANSKSALATGQARGVALLACADADIAIGEYTPMQIKQSVVGTGAADKAQVEYMVKSILMLRQPVKPDHASDALAAAICHGNFSGNRGTPTGTCARPGTWEEYVDSLDSSKVRAGSGSR